MAFWRVLHGCPRPDWRGRRFAFAMTFALVAGLAAAQTKPAVVAVVADDTVIDRSCVVRIAPGAVIPDVNGDGVIHIRADGVTVSFEPGSALRGAPANSPWSGLTGVGVRLDGHRDVRLTGLRVHGYKTGVYVSDAENVAVTDADLSDNFRQRLKSSPLAEHRDDWLWPHYNDKNEWMARYGAALYLERVKGATVRGVTVRRSQNGIALDETTGAKIYDNDCSFLSGWGVALWRSSGNTITRNAFDFCIRGYSHGKYNRGQDSAGIVLFEQSSDNLIAENSATHGGDGVLAFAGREALGEKPPPPGFDHRRKGNNRNLFIANDFSYAAAHGLELTFSFDNKIIGNRMVDNAICGVWAGYSQDTLIAGNRFEGNGKNGIRNERGGVNIEHGKGNNVHDNHFIGNECGVHFWDDDDPGLLRTPWARVNHQGAIDNRIAFNLFEKDKIAIDLRRARHTLVSGNRFVDVPQELAVDDVSKPFESESLEKDWTPPEYRALGEGRPIGRRSALAGRTNIIMDEWGPWDHEGPLARFVGVFNGCPRYEVFGLGRVDIRFEGQGMTKRSMKLGETIIVEVVPGPESAGDYELALTADGWSRIFRGRAPAR